MVRIIAPASAPDPAPDPGADTTRPARTANELREGRPARIHGLIEAHNYGRWCAES
ncbi:hypothetical protein MCNF_49420 [Mycolicibacterium confluentis]|uniref:Uncharacterized protein n=1 Tax=Mycolicibacterium confluentis TaxID=28047 RepID=A0A7I7Y3U2_9MYCO|nr:hypothetical protein MCNF_49420 [Mycolicibacterium confluentis]